MLRLSLPPFYIFFALLAYSFGAYRFAGPRYDQPVPILLVMAGVFIALFGAFYDFGEKSFTDDLKRSRIRITDEDLEHISKQQFLMTVIYFGICGLFVLSAFLVHGLLL